MSAYEEGLQYIEEAFGNGRDNLIAVATVAREPGMSGSVRPVVRTVDAYYEDGSFYTVTHAYSNKMLQIAQNPECSVASAAVMFTASGRAENLGWVLEPKNAEIREKLRTAFHAWYAAAYDESDRNWCILAVHLEKGTMNVNHWEKLYHMDFVNKTTMENGGIL